jgi:hypothetical protein
MVRFCCSSLAATAVCVAHVRALRDDVPPTWRDHGTDCHPGVILVPVRTARVTEPKGNMESTNRHSPSTIVYMPNGHGKLELSRRRRKKTQFLKPTADTHTLPHFECFSASMVECSAQPSCTFTSCSVAQSDGFVAERRTLFGRFCNSSEATMLSSTCAADKCLGHLEAAQI